MGRVHPSSETEQAELDLDVAKKLVGLEEGSRGTTHGNKKENEPLAAQPPKSLPRNSSRPQQALFRLQTQTADSLQHHMKTYRQLQMEAVEDHGVPEHKVDGTDNKSEIIELIRKQSFIKAVTRPIALNAHSLGKLWEDLESLPIGQLHKRGAELGIDEEELHKVDDSKPALVQLIVNDLVCPNPAVGLDRMVHNNGGTPHLWLRVAVRLTNAALGIAICCGTFCTPNLYDAYSEGDSLLLGALLTLALSFGVVQQYVVTQARLVCRTSGTMAWHSPSKLFDLFDKSRSGDLQMKEFVEAIRKGGNVGPKVIAQEDLERLFRAVDVHDSGIISIRKLIEYVWGKDSHEAKNAKKEEERKKSRNAKNEEPKTEVEMETDMDRQTEVELEPKPKSQPVRSRILGAEFGPLKTKLRGMSYSNWTGKVTHLDHENEDAGNDNEGRRLTKFLRKIKGNEQEQVKEEPVLQMLGAGSMVLSKKRHRILRKYIAMVDLNSTFHWAKRLLGVVVFGFFVASGKGVHEPWHNRLSAAAWLLWWILASPAGDVWIGTLHVATELIDSDIDHITLDLKKYEKKTSHHKKMSEDAEKMLQEWEEKIANPVRDLIKDLETLGKGWSGGVLAILFGYIVLSCAFVCAALSPALGPWVVEQTGREWLDSARVVAFTLTAIACILYPIMVLIAPADVSTSCDDLKEARASPDSYLVLLHE